MNEDDNENAISLMSYKKGDKSYILVDIFLLLLYWSYSFIVVKTRAFPQKKDLDVNVELQLIPTFDMTQRALILKVILFNINN